MRAVHVNNSWRPATYTSIDRALTGQLDGVPALFAGQTRIDHQRLGPALFAVVWHEHEDVGYILKPNPDAPSRPYTAIVQRAVVDTFEAARGASLLVLGSFFTAPPMNASGLATEGLEGATSIRRHMRRERLPSLVAAKKAAVLETRGHLACEACHFDFAATYGDLGANMCEVHHLEALSARPGATRTTLDDLAILCANCHRVIHATRPMWSVHQLATHLATEKA